jgi:AraC family ethanolamine operon transcriptional activator
MPVPADEERINGRILSHRFTDIDRFTEQVQSFAKVRMTQLSVEGLQCDLLLAAFSEAQFAFVKSSCPILTLGEKPRDAIIFSCVLERTGPYIISHNRKVSHHTLAGFDRDVEAKFVLPQDVHYVSLQINWNVLQDYLNVMERPDLDEWFWASNYVQVPETIATVTAYLQQILHLIQHQPHLLQQAHMKKLLLDDFIPLLIHAIPPVTRNLLKPPSPIRRSHVVKQAEDYMMAHLDQPLTLKELCTALHVSERPLFYGFQEMFGVSSDLAAFLISPVGQRFEDNIKPSLSRNFGTDLDGFE